MNKTIMNHYRAISVENLNKTINKLSKYKYKNKDSKIDIAIEGLTFYHGTSQENIMEILRCGKIKTKDMVGGAEMTNNGTDFVQGLNKHVCMSIARPWVDYGNYFFVFGIDKISDNALFFKGDPWAYNNKEMEDNFLTKQDYTTLQKELLRKNVLYINDRLLIKLPFAIDLHKLIAFNSRKYEIKNDSVLNIHDADEFIVYCRIDKFINWLFSAFGNKYLTIFLMIILIGLIRLKI